MHSFIFNFKMMKLIKVFYKKILPVILITSAMSVIYAAYIIMYPKDTFFSSYQSVIQNKFENLVNEREPKIIIIGGSSAGFGINEDLLSRETGRPVVNLGLHAGFGCLFNTEIAKANIGSKDIVLLGYEYNWFKSNSFDTLGVDLVMTGIDSTVEMYRYIPLRNWREIIGYLPEYYRKKATFSHAQGTYSRESFDEKGHMVLERDFILDYNEETYGSVDLSNVDISEKSIQYLKDFKNYVKSRGASVYFIAPPLYEKAKRSDDESFYNLARLEEEQIGIPYISNPLDYVYSEEYIYDTIYHCNSKGELKRTEQIIADLAKHHVIQD